MLRARPTLALRRALPPSRSRHALRAGTNAITRGAYYKSPEPALAKPEKVSLMFSVQHSPGSLKDALSFFWKHDINLTRLESRPSARSRDYDFYVSFEGSAADAKTRGLLKDLETSVSCKHVQLLDPAVVPWFPTRIEDTDEFANETLDAGVDLQSDHPGFKDPVYRKRREFLADLARSHQHGQRVPRVEYTPEEVKTWGVVYSKLQPLLEKYACREHRELLPLLEKHCGYAPNNIPQTADISDFMRARTGFTLRPVAGLLSSRNFLYGLAFRVFFSTQYIRHSSTPLYTPEPDICHELLGHAPLFADPNFADFSQEIGLASIGATDAQIQQLARCYWFSVEFGLCEEKGQRKAYGAGLLSSFGELEYSMSDKPKILAWDPFDAAMRDYPITTYQPVYYLAKSFEDAKIKMRDFSASMAKPCRVRYNEFTQSIEVDSSVRMMPPQRRT